MHNPSNREKFKIDLIIYSALVTEHTVQLHLSLAH